MKKSKTLHENPEHCISEESSDKAATQFDFMNHSFNKGKTLERSAGISSREANSSEMDLPELSMPNQKKISRE
jgi:hypothetical protein